MIQIPLANGKGVALIDDDDDGRIPLTGWYLHSQGYAAHRPLRLSSGRLASLLHQVVRDSPEVVEIDHRNRNKLDCRRFNLRDVTREQNSQNRAGAQRNSRLGIRGVSFQVKPSGTVCYFARVQLRGIVYYRSGFRTAEAAARAAVELRRQFFTHSEEMA